MMSDTSDIVSSILDNNSVELQDNFSQMMLDKIKAVVADRKMEIAAQFLGSLDDQEIASDTDTNDTDDMNAEDIEAEADEIGDEEDNGTEEDEGDQDEDA